MDAEERRAEVERHLTEMMAEGAVLSSREVMRRMGRSDDRILRKDWDILATEGLVPERHRSTNATEKEHGFRPGRTLLEIEQGILRFQEQFAAASDEHRRLGQEFWLRHLTKTEALLSEA